MNSDEAMVRDLAIGHMKECGEELKVRFIATYGSCIYSIIGYIVCPDCGKSHRDQLLLYMRIDNGFVLMPLRGFSRVESEKNTTIISDIPEISLDIEI